MLWLILCTGLGLSIGFLAGVAWGGRYTKLWQTRYETLADVVDEYEREMQRLLDARGAFKVVEL